MKKLLTLVLCLFCTTTFLSADEAEKKEDATETKTEQVAAAEENSTADVKEEKTQVEQSSCSSCTK